jgi:hypothetical protein
MRILDEEIARQREYNQQREAAQQQVEVDGVRVEMPSEPPKALVYNPPAYTTY